MEPHMEQVNGGDRRKEGCPYAKTATRGRAAPKVCTCEYMSCLTTLHPSRQITQEIACLLPSNMDLCNMMAACWTFSHVLQPFNSGVWRARFLQKYEPPPPVASLELGYEYKFRSIVFTDGESFRAGEGHRTHLWLLIKGRQYLPTTCIYNTLQ